MNYELRMTTYEFSTRHFLRVAVLFSLFILHSSFVQAQHYVGVKGGWGGATGRFYPKYKMATSTTGHSIDTEIGWGKSTFGIMWKYYGPQQVLGGVGAELEFQQRGYSFVYDGIRGKDTDFRVETRRVNSITLPIIWQPHLYFAKRRVRVFINAGLTLSYNLDGGGNTFTEEVWEDGAMVSSVTTPYVMQTARDNRWNYGWLGGFGVGVLVGRMEIFAEGRYYYGMADILRTKTKYIFNEMGSIRSELDNVYITVGVYFRLGKGGIKAPPLRRRPPPPPSESDFRNIKLQF